MTSRDRIAVVVLAVGAVLAGFWFVVLAPKRQDSRNLASQISDVRTQLDAATARARVAREAQRSYAHDYASVARLGKAVPADDQTAALVYQLQDVAGRSHVIFRSVKPGAGGGPPGAPAAGTTGAGVSKLPFALTFEGTYPDLERFLRRVHAFTEIHGQSIRVHGRLLSVDSVQLTTGADSTNVQATLSATAFEAPAANAAATAPAAAGQAPATSTAAPAPTQ